MSMTDDSLSSMDTAGAEHYQMTNENFCAGCHQAITDRYLLRAMDRLWHEDCLKCECCDCRLGEVGSTLYIKANLMLCKRDYFRLFGTSGQCAACHKTIPAFEMVMRAEQHVYHMDCFACHQCNLRFCVGDKFYLQGSNVVCEKHNECGGGRQDGLNYNSSPYHQPKNTAISSDESHIDRQSAESPLSNPSNNYQQAMMSRC